MPAHLRLFPTPDTAVESQEHRVPVSLGDLLPLLALAQRRNYVWLQDFLDDEVLISPDLFQVLEAFRRRPSA